MELGKQPPTPPPAAPVDVAALKALKDAVEQVTTNLNSINVSLSTDLNYLQEGFNKDHAKLVKIEDGAQNASARIKTLEVQCTRVETVDALNQTIENLGLRLHNTGMQLQEVRDAVTALTRPKATDAPTLMSTGPTSGMLAQRSGLPAQTLLGSPPRPTTPQG